MMTREMTSKPTPGPLGAAELPAVSGPLSSKGQAWLVGQPLPLTRKGCSAVRPRRGRFLWPLLFTLALLLLAHLGCHGDEDNELFLGRLGETAHGGLSNP